jgi:hypothetical protein
LAFGSWKFPVAPGLKFVGVSPALLFVPLPPQAARASSPTEDRATNGTFSLMYAPFADVRPDDDSPSGAPGSARAVAQA